MLQIIIPMAGKGSRFRDFGFETNKYLLPINTNLQYMIELAIISLNAYDCKYYFVINEEYGYDNELRMILSDICKIHDLIFEIASVNCMTDGPACTVNSIKHNLDMDQPILISNSDQILENFDFNKFMNKCHEYDGCVLTYTPAYKLTLGAIDKHSFVHITDDNVDECKEKLVLSDKALIGVHYIKNAYMFFEAYDYMISHNIRASNNEFYISLCYQSMIEQKKKIGYHDISDDEKFWPVGEPIDYFRYLYTVGGYRHHCKMLQENDILFSNCVSCIKYIVCNDNVFKNDGLIIIIKGTAICDNKILQIYDVTDLDLQIQGRCEFIYVTCNEFVKMNKIYKYQDYLRGWIVGNFEPSIIKTSQFEVGILSHRKNENWKFHYHKYMGEVNILLEGEMTINNSYVTNRHIFHIPTNQIACPKFLQDCKVLCVKFPSIIGDKICI